MATDWLLLLRERRRDPAERERPALELRRELAEPDRARRGDAGEPVRLLVSTEREREADLVHKILA